MRWIFVAVPLAVAQPDLATKSLARCCGTERATLGPLFGKLALGPLSYDDAKMVYVDGLPKSLLRDQVGLKIDLYPGEGQYHTYLDGVSIGVADHDQCVQLETRLEKMWGAPAKWRNPTRHQAASLAWAQPGADEPSCTLVIRRIPSDNAAHCLQDEKTSTIRDIDVANHCLKPRRAIRCRLDRERPHPGVFGSCVADDKAHTFASADEIVGRSCTRDELAQLDFFKLRDCP